MWKEAILMGLLAMLGYERRKNRQTESGNEIPFDRRQAKGRLTHSRSRDLLADAIEKLKQTVAFETEKNDGTNHH